MKWSYDFFIINYYQLERNDKLKKRLLFWVFIFLIFNHFLVSIYLFKIDKIQSLSEFSAGVFDLFGLILLKYKSSIVWPTILLTIYGFFVISVGVWQNGGMFSNEIGWFIITIFSITAALDRKSGIVLYFLTIFFIITMCVLQYTKQHDFTKSLVIHGENYVYMSNFAVFFIMGIILKFVFTAENINNIWKKEKEEKIELLELEKEKQLVQEKINSLNFTKQLLENTEIERKRIATDLHDSISHELLNLKSILNQDLTAVGSKIDSIIDDIRGISRNLHPVMFDKIGLLLNIEQLVERIQINNNFLINTELHYEGSLSSLEELQIYRIIQEALTNITKYAHAHAAKITIIEANGHIDIEIKDNGRGFPVKNTLNSGTAFGLHNIIERSRAIGGEAKIESSSAGTIINISIPKKPFFKTENF